MSTLMNDIETVIGDNESVGYKRSANKNAK